MKIFCLAILKNKESKFFISWIVVLAFLVLIYIFSNQNGIISNGISREITYRMETGIESILGINSQTGLPIKLDYNYIFRKVIHFVEYFVLAFIIFKALMISGIKGKNLIRYTLILCIMFAAIDEFHQMFIPGRSPRIYDVIIDSFGSFCGLYVTHFLLRRIKSH